MDAAWVNRLFTKLSVVYGREFYGRWQGQDIDAVKADWACELGGMRGDAIAYGLANLPASKPPTVLSFRDLCRNAPEPQTPRLPAPQPEQADPAKVAQVMSRAEATADSNPKAWAQALRERERRSSKDLSPFQRSAWRSALRIAPETPA